MIKFIIFALLFSFILATQYNIGTGIADITGPAAETGMMGYAVLTQRTSGIHTRLFARTYIIEDVVSKKRIVFINLDTQACMQAVKLEVVRQLKAKYGNLYDYDNVACHAQHTHSGPAGYSNYVLYNIMSLGFEKNVFDNIVNGIIQSIDIAHKRLRPGVIKINSGKLHNSNINRSPTSYLNNPEDERMKYVDGDVNKNHFILRFEEVSGKEIGVISFFSVHTTSINNTNLLISSDNKGIAELLFEEYKNGKDTIIGKGDFIASFAQLPQGDVSPNIMGTFCPDGRPCKNDSTCGGNSKYCHGRGPGKEHFESAYILGKRQFESALSIYNEAKIKLQGPIDFRHTFLKMDNITISPKYTSTKKEEKTCLPALGFSFAAGTTDGPGGWWKQGINGTNANPFWRMLIGFIRKPSKEQIACQAPKPILLDVSMTQPYNWVPDSLPIQLLRIGDLFLATLGCEITTMAGRRIESVLKRTIVENNLSKDPIVLVLPLTNAYSQYITTYEEYIAQRYEAASVLFGPHSLSAYTQELDKLALAMAKGVEVPIGPLPKNLTSKQISLNPGVVFDTHPIGKPWGTVHVQPKESYKRGERVVVEFWSGHPKNDFFTGKSYFYIEKLVNNDWKIVKTDASINTFFIWKRHFSGILPHSRVSVIWDIGEQDETGIYRIKLYGAAKPNPLSNDLKYYEGISKTFKVE